MHDFSDNEVGQVLYPWGHVEEVEARPFDREARVAEYVAALPRRPSKRWGWSEAKFSASFVGVRGILTREEAEFWFAVGTRASRLDERRGDHPSSDAEFEFGSEHAITEAFADWLDAFVERCGDIQVMTQAWLARILCDLLPPGGALGAVLRYVPERAIPTFLEHVLPPRSDELEAYRAAGSGYLLALDYSSYQSKELVRVRRRSIAERLAPLLRDVDEADKLLTFYERNPATAGSNSMLRLLNAVEDDGVFVERLRKRIPEWGRRELVLLVGRMGAAGLETLRDVVITRRGDTSQGLAAALAFVDHPIAAELLVFLSLNPTSGLQAREVLLEARHSHVAGLLQVAAGRSGRAEDAEAILQEIRRNKPNALRDAALERPDVDADLLEAAAPEPVALDLPELPESEWPRWLVESARARKPKGLPRFLTNDFIPDFLVADGEHLLPQRAVYGLLAACRDLDARSSREAADSFEDESGTSTAVVDGRPVLKRYAELLDAESKSYGFGLIFERWNQEGCPKKHDWCLRVMSIFGDDAFTLELSKWCDAWPKHDLPEVAEAGVDLLAEIGSDTALMALNGLAQRATFAAVRRRSRARLETVAARRGLRAAELEDMVIDTCGLDDRGRMSFDYGTRAFELVFDADLKPRFRDEEGEVHRSLPRARKSDDKGRVQGARARFKLVKKRLAEVLKTQRRRLEEALVDGRRWNPQRWEMTHIDHPLMTHLVQRFLWGAFDGPTLMWAFRVDESRGLVDVDDDPVDRHELSRLQVGLVHPLELGAAAEWSNVLADYEIVAPFRQLDRQTYRHDDAGELIEHLRVSGEVEPGALRGQMKRLGWTMGYPADDRAQYFTRAFGRADQRAWLLIRPGLHPTEWRRDEPQTFRDLVFTETGGPSPDDVPYITLSRVERVTLSEALRAVKRVFGDSG